MKKILLSALLLPSISLGAANFPFVKQVNIGNLQREYIAAGFCVERIDIVDGKGVVIFSCNEPKDPAPVLVAHTYIDYKTINEASRASREADLKSFSDALIAKGGSRTALEDAFLKLLQRIGVSR